MNMIDKRTKTVGFGLKGKHVVAWFCREEGAAVENDRENVCPEGGCLPTFTISYEDLEGKQSKIIQVRDSDTIQTIKDKIGYLG